MRNSRIAYYRIKIFLTAMASIFIAAVTVESIFHLIPSFQEKKSISEPAAKTSSEKSKFAVPELVEKPPEDVRAQADATAVTSQLRCTTHFYAVVETGGLPMIFKTDAPTLLGPPVALFSKSSWIHWEKLEGNSFSKCLAETDAYSIETGAPQPIDIIIFDGHSYPVIKWVCGDTCSG